MELVSLSNEIVGFRADSSLTVYDRSNSDIFSDVVTQMPDGWPNIHQLLMRHSWDFTSSIHPSVNRAMSHLNLLQTALQICQKTNTDSWQIENGFTKDKQSAELVALPSAENCQSLAAFNPDTTLCVYGVGQKQPQALCLNAEEVIEETITLLARLEKDRQDTLESLISERDRVKLLSQRIDRLALERMICLPLAVQQEHEASANDLNELKWHVTYRSRSLARLRNRVDKAHHLNSNLIEEIANKNLNIPLMNEKLQLEIEATAKITSEQVDTDAVLKSTLERLTETTDKSNAALAKAEQEREIIKSDLNAVQNRLTSSISQLESAQFLHDTYSMNCKLYTEAIAKYQTELPFEIQRNSKEKERERKQKEKVDDLERKLSDAEKTFDVLDSLQWQLEADVKCLNESFADEERKLVEMMEEREESVHLLKRKNRELEMERDIRSNKIRNCEEKKLADEKNMERMKRDIESTIERLESIGKHLETIKEDHLNATGKLEKENKKCKAAEEAQKSTVDILKKSVKEELHRKTILKGRIEADGKEFEKIQADSKTRITISESRVIEVQKAVTEITAKVNSLSTQYEENKQTLEGLKTSLCENKRQKHETLVSSDASVQELMPEQDRHKSELRKYEDQQNEMNAKADDMTKEMEVMDAAAVLIDKSTETSNINVIRLQDELEELKLQLASTQRLKNSALKSLNDVSTRDLSLETKHKEVMLNRRQILEILENELDDSKNQNKSLASKYRELQNELIHKKAEFVRQFGDRIKLENDIKDLKQLICAQSRLHAALQHYYKYRHLCTDSELTHVQVESKNSSIRVTELHKELDSAVVKMTEFLQNQLLATPQAASEAAVTNVISKIDCFHGPILPQISTTKVVG